MNNRITREEFYKTHRVCPRCGNAKLSVTLVGVVEYMDKDFTDDINSVKCEKLPELNIHGCGWKGKYTDLLP